MNSLELWQRFQDCRCEIPALDLVLDYSRMRFDDGFFARLEPALQAAYDAVAALEAGGIANPDEQRMVGHYWLRNADLAPTPEIREAITGTVAAIQRFAADIHAGVIRPPQAARFTRVLSIGIGGSALGPMFVSDALGDPATDRMEMHFLDNTDPDGIARTLARLGSEGLKSTLVLVISKSGGTPEPRNGQLLAAEAFRAAGLEFGPQTVAITSTGSALDRVAVRDGWLARFPMWDWVGGRTSELSAVGLLPAALQGLDIAGMLSGAADCDAATRGRETRRNPAAVLALMWHHGSGGHGNRDLVVLPYKDRLLLFSRYLQQLIMESLGKRLDLNGARVDQGLSVYGNKGSTDQHAYVQQLRDGVHNFFVTFLHVLESGGSQLQVEPGVTAGDYLHGFLLGTRSALYENDRESLTITVRRIDGRTIGALIALFERAVTIYASLIGINAYHQPGVEAGKKAAAVVLDLQHRALAALGSNPRTAAELAAALGSPGEVETVYHLLVHLAANGRAVLAVPGAPGSAAFTRP